TQYRAVVQSGVCPPAFSDITTITVLPGVNSTVMQPVLVETCNHDTTVTFSSTAINEGTGALKYYWYINGNVEGTTNPFSYNFAVSPSAGDATTFEVYSMAENGDGCNSTSLPGKVIINAYPMPDIKVTPGLIQREPNYSFTFRDDSPEGPADMYTWNVGDTSTPQRGGREITYQYKNTGTYEVSLFVEDKSTGCTARDTVKVTIIPVPGTLFIPNAFYPGSSHAELKTFKLKGIGIKKYRLQIFDAWGKVVFETTELNADGSPKVAWNGNYMNTGRAMPQDAYTWKIVEIEFENGKPWPGMSYNGGSAKYFGNLTLFR
ncbi:MAG: PKD domain-containing protein, partial [Chitinophagaceae bacterium]|nr:PKD domain-containing protein [Chitinophagaceae bacterium]